VKPYRRPAEGRGFTDLAFVEGAVFIREELKKKEKDQPRFIANRLQSDLASMSSKRSRAVPPRFRRRRGQRGTGLWQWASKLMNQLRETRRLDGW